MYCVLFDLQVGCIFCTRFMFSRLQKSFISPLNAVSYFKSILYLIIYIIHMAYIRPTHLVPGLDM